MKQQLGLCLVFLVAVAALSVPPAPKTKKPQRQDFVVIVKDATSPKPQMETIPAANVPKATANPINESYPLLKGGVYKILGDSYGVASPNVIDPLRKDPAGVSPGVVQFGQPPPDYHPMEIKTPLIDPRPCDQTKILKVEVLSADHSQTRAHPVLPPQFGCSAEKEVSREKASPIVRWSNYTIDEVEAFSFQMISMGDDTCKGQGSDTYNTIHWHITDMKAKDESMTLELGASKDRRMIFGGREQPNQWLEDYYAGPCPPPGVTECFRFKVVAHLRNSQDCYCGFEDVLFTRPENAMADPVPWAYDAPVLAPVGKKRI